MRVPRDLLRGVAGHVHQDVHSDDEQTNRRGESGGVELAVRAKKLRQVEAGKVAGRIVKEHVLGAGVGGVDRTGGLGCVPAVDGGVKLHARVATRKRLDSYLTKQIGGLDRLCCGSSYASLQVPVANLLRQ